MKYRITCWHDATFTAHETTTRATRQAAFQQAYRMAYDQLEAFGKLDTQSAWNVRRDIEMRNDIMQVGEQRSVSISNTGYSVTVNAIAT